jgi:hypothetical protein
MSRGTWNLPLSLPLISLPINYRRAPASELIIFRPSFSDETFGVMTAGNQVKPIEKSAPSDGDLEKAALELVFPENVPGRGHANIECQTTENLLIDADESHPKSFTTADSTVRAVLVYKNGPPGAVRVTGPGTPTPVPNVVTGPDGKGLEVVEVKPGQTCMFLGEPTVRFFRYRSN